LFKFPVDVSKLESPNFVQNYIIFLEYRNTVLYFLVFYAVKKSKPNNYAGFSLMMNYHYQSCIYLLLKIYA